MIVKVGPYRYSRWDGSQKEKDLAFKSLTDDLFDKFIQTGDMSLALEWLLRQGANIDLGGFDLTGLDKMMENLEKLRQEMLSKYSMSTMADEFKRELNEIVDMERKELKDRFDKASKRREINPADEAAMKEMQDNFQSEGMLDSLPENLGQTIDKLKRYNWKSDDARRRFHDLLKLIQQIQEFAANNWFQGSVPLSLDQMQDVMNRIGGINEILAALSEGNLADINLSSLAGLLGPEAKESLETMLQFMEYLREQGYIDNVFGQWDITAKAIRRIGQMALRDIFDSVLKGRFGGHRISKSGPGTVVPDVSRDYEFGMPLNVDLKSTLIKSILRSPKLPIEIDPRDFTVNEMEFEVASSTALMLDMSLSMFREGRFAAAKRVAIALDHLIRTQYPRDNFYVIGFSTLARELRGKELAHASGSLGGDVFTNIQDGLKLACKLLGRHPAGTKQVILITDGQPTAYTLKGKLHVEWPLFGISPNANRETLKEVRRVTAQEITINTFMLDSSEELVKFINQLTKINKGRAFYTTPDKLGKYLLVDYMNKRKRSVQ